MELETNNNHINGKQLRLLVYGGSGGSGGYISYCKGLFGSGWVPDNIDVRFVCSPKFMDELEHLDSNVGVVQHEWIGNRSILKRLIWHLFLYPRLLKKENIDVEFYPAGFLPLFRRFYAGKAVLATTCHNLLPFDLKKTGQYSTLDYNGLSVIQKKLKQFYKKAAGVIFLSEYSRKIVLEQLNFSPKSVIIPHGLEEGFRLNRQRSYLIHESCTILYVSPVFPYKHHDNVIRAVKNVRDISNYNIHLRLVGGGSNSSVRKLEEMIDMEQAGSYVNLIGQIGRLELQHELNNADIYIFASSCETFGITLLEGMGFRLPVASSNQSGLDDILKDAGVYFAPDDIISISEAITKLLNSESLRQTSGEKAYKYANDYSWQKCSSSTFSFLWTLKR